MSKAKAAIVITPEHRDELLETVPHVSRMPARDVLVFEVSFYGALRVCEIAQLAIDAMLGPRGEILDVIRIAPWTTKRNRGRTIPMHPRIKAALADFLDVYPHAEWVAMSPRDGRMMTPAALGKAMERIYERAGFPGCRSHTGRATCLTEMAKIANLEGCTLEDIQQFAGHKRLETTGKYLGLTGNLSRLVNAIGSHSNKERRMSNGTFEQGNRYWANSPGLRLGHHGRRPRRPGLASEPGGHGNGRRDAERLARRLEHGQASRRKLRKPHPVRRDR